MQRIKRAAQFAPFDALKGLQDALRIKEYEHDRIMQGEVSEEKAKEISDKLLSLKKGDKVEVKYFDDGYYKTVSGSAKLIIEERVLKIDKIGIRLDCISELNIK